MSDALVIKCEDAVSQFINEIDHSLFYYCPKYLQMISELLDAEYFYLGIKQRNNLNSLLPVMKKKSELGVVYNSLAYYGSNGGVLQKAPCMQEKKQLLKKFCELAAGDDSLSATVVTNPFDTDYGDIWKELGLTSQDYRIGQLTELPSKTDTLLETFKNPRPRNIRRALNSGIEISICQNSAIDFLFDTHKSNIEAIGGLPKDKSFFSNISQFIPEEKWRIYVAQKDKKNIGALLLFYHNSTIEYFTPVTVYEYRNLQPSALIIYTAMCDAINQGFKWWNWGGTWANQNGVYDFKKRWGAVDMRYDYFTKVFNQRVWHFSKNKLLENFPGFYVVNFKFLREN